MLHETSPRPSSTFTNIFLFAAACLCLVLSATAAQGQKTTRAKTAATETTAKGGGADEPCFREYRGVQIGMSIDEARVKLGTPKDKADELDIYFFSEKESAQVYYDKKTMKVTAISVDYTGGAGAPECKAVVGAEVTAKADGSKFKMVRYPKEGYWVSYNRTSGDTPMVTVTMQKIQ